MFDRETSGFKTFRTEFCQSTLLTKQVKVIDGNGGFEGVSGPCGCCELRRIHDPRHVETIALHASVRGRALRGYPADGPDGFLELQRLHANPPFRSGHPTDGLLHQRPAEVVRSSPKDRLARFDTHLDPRDL